MGSNLSVFCLSLESSIHDAIACIEQNAGGIALVVGRDDQFIGVVTDGDIRRALLKGVSLASPLEPHIQRNFVAVNPEAGRTEVLDLLQARRLNQVPIVDKEGKLCGLHLLHEIIGAVERSNWAVIMAGGKGNRLYPITENVPKPMLRVAGRPILERLVLHLVGFGIRRIFLAINYKGPMIEAHFKDGGRFGCRVEYLRETEPLGTGGALALLQEKPVHPVVVLNGDLVTQVNLEHMLAFHTHGKFAATMGVRRYLHHVPFGCIESDGTRISRFEEKPVLERLINAGVYVLSPELAAQVPRRFFPITDLFEDCLKRGEEVGAFYVEEDWIDVGQHEQLKQAREGIE